MLSRLSLFGRVLPRSVSVLPARFVSQSKPSSATGSMAVTEPHAAVAQPGHGEVSPYVKNPDYHGFSMDPVEDEWNMKVGFFLGISVALVIGGAFIHYLPDLGPLGLTEVEDNPEGTSANRRRSDSAVDVELQSSTDTDV